MNARLHRRKELLLHYSKLLIKYAEVYSDECFVLDSIAFKLCCYTIIQLASVWAPDWIFDSFKSLYPKINWRQIRAFRNHAAHPSVDSDFDFELFRTVVFIQLPLLVHYLEQSNLPTTSHFV